jgi:HEAT repeat protein
VWDNLFRVDWGRLTHAYGCACDTPTILRNMVAADQATRAEGWDAFWGSINHQGNFYDSTVAVIPFLIEAVAQPDTPERAEILDYFRGRWLNAPEYGGDPLVTEPPGGTDVPIPMFTDEELVAWQKQPPPGEGAEQESDEEFDIGAYRRMDLCAWQTGRAIQAGRPMFERLLDDPDLEVAAGAATILLMWRDTRDRAKQALVRTVAKEVNPIEQARRVLEFGVYAAAEDIGTLSEWIAPDRPALVRAAAALVWAWVVNPAQPPRSVAVILEAASGPGADAFATLPWVGVYHRGPWMLPANTAELILRLAESEDRDLRWRAIQGLAEDRETAKHVSTAQAVPVLLKRLSDDYNRICVAAAQALSQRGEAVLDVEPNAVVVLIRALEAHRSPAWGDGIVGLDRDASICGHAARLLAAVSHRLTSLQRQAALAGIDRAARRYEGHDERVWFSYTAVEASQFLRHQRELLDRSQEWSLTELFAAVAFPDREFQQRSPGDCDRRLADMYGRAPEQVITSAIEAVRTASDRTTAIGAAKWLMTLGPAAEAALEALDAMADGQLDDYARDWAREAGAIIRQALLITRDGKEPRQSADAIPALERMLADEDFTDVGIVGEFECEGRLFHWRRERRSPRESAIRALFAIGHVPRGDGMLKAMLAEATFAKVVCGTFAVPRRFAIAEWRLASEAVGGLSVADPLIRATRQQCQNQPWPGNNAAHVCEAELAEVIRVLSGRLVP